jgi:hypothetical protein
MHVTLVWKARTGAVSFPPDRSLDLFPASKLNLVIKYHLQIFHPYLDALRVASLPPPKEPLFVPSMHANPANAV